MSPAANLSMFQINLQKKASPDVLRTNSMMSSKNGAKLLPIVTSPSKGAIKAEPGNYFSQSRAMT